MLKEIISTGKTVNEAVANALEQYSLKRDEVELEIIEREKGGFLGFGKKPAKVKITFEAAETKEQKPKQEKQAPKQERPAKKAPAPKKEEKRAEKAPKSVEERPHVEMREGVLTVAEGTEEIYIKKAELAKDYVERIIKAMGISEFFIDTEVSNESIILSLEGDEIGFIIGRRGETLDSIQYLAGLATNKLDGEYVRISINSGSFREKRKQTLEELAERLAATVKRTSRNITLEPMNPYERRIIHSTVSKFEGVTSRSVGEEPNRRVVISSLRKFNGNGKPRRGGKPYHKNNGYQRRNNYSQNQDRNSSEERTEDSPKQEFRQNDFNGSNGFNDSNRKDFTVQNQAAKAKVPEELKTKPLYSKIEIY